MKEIPSSSLPPNRGKHFLRGLGYFQHCKAGAGGIVLSMQGHAHQLKSSGLWKPPYAAQITQTAKKCASVSQSSKDTCVTSDGKAKGTEDTCITSTGPDMSSQHVLAVSCHGATENIRSAGLMQSRHTYSGTPSQARWSNGIQPCLTKDLTQFFALMLQSQGHHAWQWRPELMCLQHLYPQHKPSLSCQSSP